MLLFSYPLSPFFSFPIFLLSLFSFVFYIMIILITFVEGKGCMSLQGECCRCPLMLATETVQSILVLEAKQQRPPLKHQGGPIVLHQLLCFEASRFCCALCVCKGHWKAREAAQIKTSDGFDPLLFTWQICFDGDKSQVNRLLDLLQE